MYRTTRQADSVENVLSFFELRDMEEEIKYRSINISNSQFEKPCVFSCVFSAVSNCQLFKTAAAQTFMYFPTLLK